MECTKCGSTKVGIHDRNASKSTMRMKCRDCGDTWTVPKTDPVKKDHPKVGMSLDQFRAKHDTEFIVDKTLKTLDRKLIYEKADVIKLSKLSHGTQGITAILESKSEYYGKVGGRQYFSHPDTIADLKERGKLN